MGCPQVLLELPPPPHLPPSSTAWELGLGQGGCYCSQLLKCQREPHLLSAPKHSRTECRLMTGNLVITAALAQGLGTLRLSEKNKRQQKKNQVLDIVRRPP